MNVPAYTHNLVEKPFSNGSKTANFVKSSPVKLLHYDLFSISPACCKVSTALIMAGTGLTELDILWNRTEAENPAGTVGP